MWHTNEKICIFLRGEYSWWGVKGACGRIDGWEVASNVLFL